MDSGVEEEARSNATIPPIGFASVVTCYSLDFRFTMIISTRTPEGEPLKCGVCGHEHLVLLSSPPGDSVCPTCGSHAWLSSHKNKEPFPTPEVLQSIPGFVDKIRLSRSRIEVATHLIDGLYLCLAARGVTLWMTIPGAGTEPKQFDRVASKGETHSSDFSNAVAEEQLPIMRVAKTSIGERLLIGVPLMAKNGFNVIGVIEVAQRTETPVDARDGFLRFARTMVAVTAGSRAFSQIQIEQ